MPNPQPFVREAGAGPRVVCIHANASTSGQWRALMDALAPNYHVLAPDCYGCGKTADWPSDRVIRLQDEVDLLEPVFTAAGESFALVGHSYGAAIALLAALRYRERVRALVLYEPTLFALVDARQPPPNGTAGIRAVAAAASAALDEGDRERAAGYFIDFWMGSGTWAATPGERKPSIVDSVANIRRWSHALLTEPTPVEAFSQLDIPILYMEGAESPESSRAVARVLQPVLKRVEITRFPGLGHMAPVTHPAVVNQEIVRFLGAV